MKIDGKVSIGMTPYSSIRESGNPNTEAPVATLSPVKKNPSDPVGSLTQATPLLHISSGLKRPPTSAPPGYMGQGPIITGAGQSSASPNHPNNNTGSGYQSAASKFVGNESSAFFSAKGDFSVSGIANPNNQSRNNNILVPSREDDRDPEDQTMYSAVSGNNSAFYSAQPSRFVSAFGDNTQRGSTQDTRNILGEVDQSLPIKILPPGLLTDQPLH